jgi:hypothetical protein
MECLPSCHVTSYLHDVLIARKVRDFGFKGPVSMARADELAGIGHTPPSLFS